MLLPVLFITSNSIILSLLLPLHVSFITGNTIIVSLQIGGRNLSLSFYRISDFVFSVAHVIHHGQHNNSLAPNWRKEFQPIIFSLRVGGRNFSLSFCRSKLEEGILAYHFIAPNWRKVSSHDVLLINTHGMNYISFGEWTNLCHSCHEWHNQKPN
jgi:hypothetical protein